MVMTTPFWRRGGASDDDDANDAAPLALPGDPDDDDWDRDDSEDDPQDDQEPDDYPDDYPGDDPGDDEDAPDDALLIDVDGDGEPDRVILPRAAPRWAPQSGRPRAALPGEHEDPDDERADEVAVREPDDLAIPGEAEEAPESERRPHVQTVEASVLLHEDIRRPIIPVWMRTRGGVEATVRWWLGLQWHRIRFHILRTPRYALRVLLRAPRGAGRLYLRWYRWKTDADSHGIAQTIASSPKNPDIPLYLKVTSLRDGRAAARTIQSAIWGAVAVLIGVLLMTAPVPASVPVPAGVLPGARACLLLWLLGALAKAGTDRDAPLIEYAVTTFEAPKLTAPMIEKALTQIGVPELTKALQPGGEGIRYAAPITREALGWRADIDLPGGVQPVDVIQKRGKLASALRRQAGCVWPEGDPEIHEGRLVLHVLNQDFAKIKPPAWPLAKSGRHDYFQPYLFGWGTRGEVIKLCLFEINMLVGAIPGQGKSATLRVAASAAALDPTVELRIAELAGKGDFDGLAPVCRVYINGIDDDSIRQAAEMLADLRAECERRLTVLGKTVPADMKPDKKVTREIADHRAWGLHPIVAVLDECQNAFIHKVYGKQAAEDAEVIIRTSRAVAVTLLMGTQRPDSRSLPTGISAMAGVRYCLKVMGHVENDMILGTGMHANGHRATMLRLTVDAGIGVLVGVLGMPTIAKSAYLDGPAAAAIGQRARKMREAAGTLCGYALGEDMSAPLIVVSVVEDVAAVFRPGETSLWNEGILERLQELRPGYYDSWQAKQITSALRSAGVAKAGDQVSGVTDDGRRANRRGVYLADLQDALIRALPEGGGPVD